MIEILCSDVSDGNMSSNYSDDGRKNRTIYFKKNNIEYKNSIYLNAQNKNIIFDTKKDKCNPPNKYGVIYADADAIVTQKDVFIYCLFGDCIPFVIFDKKKEIVALAHLGWQSVEGNLHLKLIEYLINEYKSSIDDLDIYLGPSIKKESHKISIDQEIKQINDLNWKDYISIQEDYYLIDLVGYVISTLKKKNIRNITVDKTDTYKSKNYFSHHRSCQDGSVNGRFVYGVRMKRGIKC